MTLMARHLVVCRIGFALSVSLMFGCGSSGGPPRYELSGTVTLDGKPVPAGKIVLEPDTTKGNKGPGTSAVIKDGKFSTPKGLGTVGGPHLAKVSAYDGKKFTGDEAETKPMGNELSKPQEFRVDLPKTTATHEFTLKK